MRFVVDKWRRIGTRLYVALGFAVALTLISAAVGVYYFEQSGNLNDRVRSESVPALEASWEAAREAERLRGIGQGVLTGAGEAAQVTPRGAVDNSLGGAGSLAGAVDQSLEMLEAALSEASSLPELADQAQAVSDAAYDLAEDIDGLASNGGELADAYGAGDALRAELDGLFVVGGDSEEALHVLERAFQAGDGAELDGLWDEFSALYDRGIDQALGDLGGGTGIFFVRRQQLALEEVQRGLASSFAGSSAALEATVSSLTTEASAYSSESLEEAVGSFDEGRTLLTAISVISVVAATLAAWLWVGNRMVRRLSRMSERMRGMAGGDLETPVPEVGRDEIGELAGALEVFRQQALEVQRLNLVEQLYAELRESNAELERTQARLVAQQKLAALGELVSGVAHEIRNPLNFVNNFSEGALELHSELSEMLTTYRDKMSEPDSALLDEISEELTTNLNRVLSNGGRALAIVERMRGLGVTGGDPAMEDLNRVVEAAVQVGCNTFIAEYPEFSVEQEYDLDPGIGQVSLVERDFTEAILNLVSNACYAMRQKGETAEPGYAPRLAVSTRVVDGEVEVRVRDNGTGIPEEVKGQIFNPFFSTREGAAGAGLGLPIAADVARRLGGDLSVDSAPGEYTEFIMTLPMVTAPEIPPLPFG